MTDNCLYNTSGKNYDVGMVHGAIYIFHKKYDYAFNAWNYGDYVGTVFGNVMHGGYSVKVWFAGLKGEEIAFAEETKEIAFHKLKLKLIELGITSDLLDLNLEYYMVNDV